ncbi:MAG TPA: amidohydrolase family protein [Chloroflexota bacterium]|nr:amidohydrolase family protein [Chloroflexota bacterium]
MAVTGAPLVIALEEHYYDAEVAATFDGPEGRAPEARRRLFDLGELRLAEMDAAGIDVQVLSHGAPSVQRLDAETSVWMARGANDRLAEAIALHPDRFAGFAALPTPDPEAAAAELDRAVTTLGFKGAMVHGLTNGVFLDDRRFWPIFERAQALDVPLYLHPAVPDPAVVEAYYQDYLQEFPSLLTAAWGFTVETATQAIRMVLSGAFEAFPRLKIILGHMGEGLPFLLWRLDHALSRPGNRPISFREQFSQHVWITTSGNFSTPALLCSMLELGVDRIMFSVDWPFVQNPPGTAWLEALQISAEDKAKIAGGNAKHLLKL